MPLKCYVPRCNSYYDSTKVSVTVYRFPHATCELERLLYGKDSSNMIGENGEQELRSFLKFADLERRFGE